MSRAATPTLAAARRAVADAAVSVAEWYVFPPVLAEAVVALVAVQERAAAELEDRLRRSLATAVHYTDTPGDRRTRCGTDARTTLPCGWVGAGLEFIRRRLDTGGAVCPDCLIGLDIGRPLAVGPDGLEPVPS